jgi:formate dehydrogenase major subunit
MGANPTDAHPVFASRLKKRLRAGPKLIVIDPRRIDLVKSARVEAARHLALRPETNVAVITALAHVIVTEGLANETVIAVSCHTESLADYVAWVSDARHSLEATQALAGVPTEALRARARTFATGAMARSTTGSG